MTYSWQVKDAEHRLRHKLFPPIAWMKLTDFHISTATDRRTLLSAAVPMVLALPHGGAAIFTRSTTWLWNFGRPQPRVGDLSVAKTEKLRRKSRSEASKRGWATKRARK